MDVETYLAGIRAKLPSIKDSVDFWFRHYKPTAKRGTKGGATVPVRIPNKDKERRIREARKKLDAEIRAREKHLTKAGQP